MRRFTNLSFFATLFFLVVSIFSANAQGVTTSSINGKVVDTDGETLPGANVIAVHVPSGTSYGTASNKKGYYRIANMRVGGPYKITVSFTGFTDYEKENVYLSLGQAYQLNVELNIGNVELEGVEVIANRNELFDGNRDGQETTVDLQTINRVPTVTRSIADFARFNPLANITENVDGFSISLAGNNNRYNAIYIDGAVNNDAFGLAGSGTNGGQTGVQPISIDAIEQFTISVAPFDVRQSGFAGGSINAVTRSGTNEFEGSAYYFWRNEDLAGETPTNLSNRSRDKLADFSANTYGFRLGGSIIKNELFFFVNAELQDDATPQPFDFEDYRGNATLADINQFSDVLRRNYGYDPGVFDNNEATLESVKFLAKVDWNINEKHKLSVRHSYVEAENLEARRSSRSEIEFLNGSEFFKTTTNSSAVELNSVFSNELSNRLIVGLTFVRDDRDPFGNDFPTIEVQDGDDGDIIAGAERFSTANLLNQDIITINNDLTLYKGKHSLLFGVNFEMFNAGNLFIRNNFGRYRWFDGDNMTGLERFLAGSPADQFERSFSQVDNITGDDSEAIADFSQMLLGVYVQDDYQVNENFKVSAGIRLDVPIWPDDQPVNEEFNNTTIPAIESFGYDLQGAQTGQFIGAELMFSPRVGFNWDITGDNINQLRGGAGIFTSRIPLVWPGGAYNNYGFNIGEFSDEDVAFEPDVNNQPPGNIDLNDPTPSGQVDLFAEDFRLPQVFKANLAYDRQLPGGVTLSVEGLYSKYLNNVRYQNLNLKPAVRTLDGGPDQRPLFEGTQAGFGDDVIDPTYTYIMLASNTDLGYTYNAAVTLQKRFNKGFTALVSYSYGDAYTINDGTSSQNNSQWRGLYYQPLSPGDEGYALGRNADINQTMRSSFAQGHRIFGQVSYEIDYANAAKSTFSLNFNGQTGGFFNYVVGQRNFLFVDDGGFDNNELIYVPNSIDDINLVELTVDGETYSAADQWVILTSFIENDRNLRKRRGGYAERNDGVLPFEFTVDLRFLQDFYVKVGEKKHTLQFSMDIFNFTNMLNKSWGLRRFMGNFGNYQLLNLENVTLGSTVTPEYTINPDLINGENPRRGNIDDSGFRSSRWQMQLGVRYIFD